VRLLLDTSTFLPFISGNEQLSQTAREIIADMDNEAFLSVASLWEIAIKASLGKLILTGPFSELIPEQLDLNEIRMLPIELGDLSVVADLPFHHSDPFDRLIVAQAVARRLPIVGNDQVFAKYPIELIWRDRTSGKPTG
jgi:PIN domain nuclease of toxin-antitoxin system